MLLMQVRWIATINGLYQVPGRTTGHSNGCGINIGVTDEGKEAKIVGVRGRAVDRVNKGTLRPKVCHIARDILSRLFLICHRIARLGK
jgi:hypothetical protein